MGSNTDTDVQQVALGYTRMFGSNKLNDLRFGFGKLKNGHISPRANVDNVVGRLGINLPNDNPLYWGVPNIGVTGLSGIGEESDAPFINDDTTLQIVDNFTWTRRQALVQVRRRAAARPLRPDRRRRDARPVGVRRPLHAEPAAAGGAARRRRVRRLPARTLQSLGRTGRRADRELPIQLLRALRAGQLEGSRRT